MLSDHATYVDGFGPAFAEALANDTPTAEIPLFTPISTPGEKEGEMQSPVRHPKILHGI